MARRFNFNLSVESNFRKTARAVISGQEMRFLVPTTFMNLSGKAVSALANFYRIPPEQILVLHDELDFSCASLKLSKAEDMVT